ncbi:MAG TPA: DUF6055 domain-containing protein [Polyangia bacterium]|nr:DUF6055 domain-containing protein [Polyangia bacterium]
MARETFQWLGLLGLLTLAASLGCANSDSGTVNPSGTGGSGTTGTGGATGTGGSTGVAGSTGSGGTGTTGTGGGGVGTGGAGAGAGGATATGGATGATGGNRGTAGATATGGSTGTGGAAGATGTGGSAGTSGGASDYPYCNYGNVPSGTAPAAWNDNPTLTPIGTNPYGKPTNTMAVGYILLSSGPTLPTGVTTALEMTSLMRVNADIKYVTQLTYTHLPPWTTGGALHYIDYILVGTGLPNDPTTGGDSSYEGSYPDVETTGVAMTDPSQRYDLTHEFFHVLENSYGTVPGQKVSWIQESYNDYLILRVAENVGNATAGQATQFKLPSNVGYLDALVYQWPQAPIESCGIEKDNVTLTGPADYLMDSTGFRYNDLFPLFVSQRVGMHFFAAVWEQAKTTEQILQTMTRLLDKPRVQCMVQEYAARLALGDFMELSSSIQAFGDPGMYAATTNSGGTLSPSDATKLPRYTSRNNIPITVASGATSVSVNFTPDAAGSNGTPSTMSAGLVYRATDGTAVYGQPVSTGTASITLTKAPKGGVVVLVITNVTLDGYKTALSYGWDPSETFGYKIQITGGTAAPTNKIYF